MAKRPVKKRKSGAKKVGASGSRKLDGKTPRRGGKAGPSVRRRAEPTPRRRPPDPRRAGTGRVAAERRTPEPVPERRAPEREVGLLDVESIRVRLARDRDDTIARLRDMGASPDADESAPRSGADSVLDEGDRAQASVHQDMSFMTRERLADRITRLTIALERISAGTYGTCAVCGNAIELQRLAAMPEAETCLACQTERERNAPRLPRSASV